jgi:hypothetical protein
MWIPHEIHDQLSENDVEASVGEREVLCITNPDVNPGKSRSAGRDE